MKLTAGFGTALESQALKFGSSSGKVSQFVPPCMTAVSSADFSR